MPCEVLVWPDDTTWRSIYKQGFRHPFYTSVTTLVQSLLYWLEEAEFLLCHDGVHFITENRSFNFERPDRANP